MYILLLFIVKIDSRHTSLVLVTNGRRKKIYTFCNNNNECVDKNECMFVCFPGHGVLPDAVRAGGGDPVQAGARKEGHH